MNKLLFPHLTGIFFCFSNSIFSSPLADQANLLLCGDPGKINSRKLISSNYDEPRNAEGADTLHGEFTHYVGEFFGGGVVVAVWKVAGVEKGLIVGPEELSPPDCPCAAWSNITDIAVGPSAQNPSDGLSNTNAIIRQPGHTSSAAQLCADYERDGFTDWYLPSLHELGIFYQNVYLVSLLYEEDGDPSTHPVTMDDHWSSFEDNEMRAVRLSFTGMMGFTSTEKTNLFGRVRPMRRF